MVPTLHDLIRTAVTAAQNQQMAQTATRSAVAGIAAQRGAEAPATATPAGGTDEGPK